MVDASLGPRALPLGAADFIDLPAPAKLNLFLHLVGQRGDGYHLLRSVFLPIGWADTVSLTRRIDGDVRLRVTEGSAPTGDATQDLAVRAARALQRETGCRLGADIELRKRIPTGAGLGGGSSDAATTLIGLNQLWQLGLRRAQLSQIGLGLGADVPFFLGQGPALVQGIGELLTALPPGHPWAQPRTWAVLKPPASVPTAAVFRHPDLPRPWRDGQSAQPAVVDPAILMGFAESGQSVFQSLAGPVLRNDLQAVAQAIEPQISDGLQWLQAQGLSSPQMSGSGSAVFAALDPAQVAVVRQAALPGEGWVLNICQSLGQLPLAGWLAD
jgi:4-diphosphocytidyl-2-C-methyl-D-erythritol kinase